MSYCRTIPSVIKLLVKYLLVTDKNTSDATNEEALAHCLSKQLTMEKGQLDYISGFAVDYIGRLFCLLYYRSFMLHGYI